jgi:cytoskeletal protein CcmA (bactofilin family)
MSAITSFATDTLLFGTATSSPPAILGKDVTVMGEVRSREPLTIEGEVEGTIDVAGHLLTVAASGTVRASVKAKEIDVLGSLEGNVEGADKIYIRAGARFLGDIRAHGIVIEDGGFVQGDVDLSQPSGVARTV